MQALESRHRVTMLVGLRLERNEDLPGSICLIKRELVAIGDRAFNEGAGVLVDVVVLHMF